MLLSDFIACTGDSMGVDATLEEAIALMDSQNGRHAVFVRDNKPVGILTLKNIMHLYQEGAERGAPAFDYAVYPVVTIHRDRPVDMALEMMIDYDIRRIVLVDDAEHYAGTLTQSDLLTYYETSSRNTNEVFYVLNKRNRAVLIDKNATIIEAIALMRTGNRDVLGVTEEGSVAGILTERDILMLASRKIGGGESISPYVHSPVVYVGIDEPIERAAQKMKELGIHHLAVDGSNNQLYILSDKDLVFNYNTALEVKLEAKLRDAKATYNLLGIAYFEIIDIGSLHIIKWLNAEAMLTFGVKIDEPAFKVFGRADWERLIATLERFGGVEREQYEIGGRIYEVTLLEAEVEKQQVLKLFMQDISELVRLGDELRRSLEHTIELEQEKSRLYLDVASVTFLAMDKEGKVVLLNPKGCEILGVSREEAIGKNWFDSFVASEDRGRSREMFEAIMSGKMELVEYYENRVRTKEGGERIIAWHNSLLQDEEGNITGTFSSGEDITRVRETEREIQRVSHYDALTNLPNRTLLGVLLEHSIERARREKGKIGVLYVDIDHFKDINESYGYRMGDLVIKMISSRMKTLIRHEDTMARIGGDEFVILLEEIKHVSECERTIEQIIELFREPIATPEGELKLTASIGIALYPDDGDESEALLKNAEIALRQAKENGYNNYFFYTPQMSVQLFERVLMEKELRRAVEEGEFVVYFQPQVDLSNRILIGAEALVRWKHPILGIVSPDVFIPIAEANHLIVPIGERVLQEACRIVKRWREAGLFAGRVSVNVSGKQIERSDVIEVIGGIIARSGLPPEAVELEITESVLMGNPEIVGNRLVALKQHGIEVAIDDFGTGYSSLSYLKTFPIDKVKIDQSFVRALPDDEQDRAIVKAIIAMADALGLKTIAEGIENAEQEQALKEFGCRQGQGYLFARPLSEEQFEEFLKYNETLNSKG